jgi:hypothetical protein
VRPRTVSKEVPSTPEALPRIRRTSLDEGPVRWQIIGIMKLVHASSLAAVALLSLACGRSSASEPPHALAIAPSEAPVAMADSKLDAAEHMVVFDQKQGCTVGAVCAATIRLETKGGFHVNDAFPYKFKGSENPGVELQGSDAAKKNDFSKSAGDLTLDSKTVATLAVRFKLTQKQGTVSGTYKYAVCNESNCFPKEASLSLAVSAK